MREQLGEYLDELALDDAIKVVLLRGEGGVFSTGADMANAYAWYGNGERRSGDPTATEPTATTVRRSQDRSASTTTSSAIRRSRSPRFAASRSAAVSSSR